jgi:hypothetical protein
MKGRKKEGKKDGRHTLVDGRRKGTQMPSFLDLLGWLGLHPNLFPGGQSGKSQG